MPIHHIAITVKDLEKSVAFYQRHFGAQQVKEFSRPDLGGEAVFLKLENSILEIWQFAKSGESPRLKELNQIGIRHFAFSVPDIEKAVASLKESGIECSEPKLGASGARYAFTSDPDGIPIELYELRN